MANPKKKEFISSLNDSLNNSNSVVVVNPHRLNAQESTKLRNDLRKKKVKFQVIKNTLTKIAIKDTSYEKLAPLLKGPTAIVYSDDSIAVSKAIVDFSKQNDKIQILGGVIDKEFVDTNSIKQIAELPSLDELRATIVGLISAPATHIARVVKAPAEQLARVLNAYSTKKQ